MTAPGDAHERAAAGIVETLAGLRHPGAARDSLAPRPRPRANRAHLAPVDATRFPAPIRDVVASPGERLDAATRRLVTPDLGVDAEAIRVHADARAAQSADAVGARAYTVGSHVVFAAGAYRPHTTAGRGLLLHELAHTAQHDGAPRVSRSAVEEAPPPGVKELSRAERKLARFEYEDKLAEIEAELRGEKYVSKLGHLDEKDIHELYVLAAEIAGGCRDGVCSDRQMTLVRNIVALLLADPPEEMPADRPPQAVVRETFRAPQLEIDFATKPGVVIISGPELPTVEIPIVDITVVEQRNVIIVQPEVKQPQPPDAPVYVDYPPPPPLPAPPTPSGLPTIEWADMKDAKVGGCTGMFEPGGDPACEIELGDLLDPGAFSPVSGKVTVDSTGAYLVVEVTPALGQFFEIPVGTVKVPLQMCEDCGTPWSDPNEIEIPDDYEERLERYNELLKEYAETGKRPLDIRLDMQFPE